MTAPRHGVSKEEALQLALMTLGLFAVVLLVVWMATQA